MTDEEADALGARLAACKHFRPLPGLRDMQGRTWEQSLLWRWSPEVDRPDMREPATKGIVMALVRDAWGGKCGYMHNSGYQWLWIVRPLEGMPVVRGAGATEAEALVAALEAAP